MGFVAPALLWVVAVAAAATVALHLLSWRRPRPRHLPTARFLGAAAQPSRFRRVEPTDVGVLALRLLALASAGAAIAGPVATWRREGTARVIVVDRSRAVASPGEVRDSVRALLVGAATARIVAFDSSATMTTLDEVERLPVSTDTRGNLAAGLVAAIREATALAAAYRSVEIVVVSPVVMEEGSPALEALASTWSGQRRLARVAAREATEPVAIAGAALPPATDPVGAAARLAWGALPAHLRLVRGLVTAADSAFARAGGTLVAWPRGDADGAPAVALTTGEIAVVGSWGRTATVATGATIARWHDGSAAAWEVPVGAGCVREVAVAVPTRGDAVLRPAFLALVRAITAPCGEADVRPIAAGALAWTSTSAGTRAVSAAAAAPNAALQRALLALTLIALGGEWWLRRRPRGGAGAGMAPSAGRQRAA